MLGLVTRSALGVVWTLALAACAKAEAPPPAPVDPAAALGPTATLAMQRVRLEPAGLALDIVEGPHSVTAWDVGGVLIQTVPLSDDDVLRIVVRAGEEESLAELRRDHPDAHPRPRAAARVCGRPARRLDLLEDEVFIECIEYADGRPSEPGYIPATTVTAQSFAHGRLRVVAVWDIPTALRDRYRAQERRFFDSFACDAS